MNAIEIFLLIVVILICIIVLISNFYILVYFSHPEDSYTKGIWLYRGLVVDLCYYRLECCLLLDI